MVSQEASSLSVKLDLDKTDNKLFTENRTTPSISFEEAQLIVQKVITHLNTGRGRVWSKLTAA